MTALLEVVASHLDTWRRAAPGPLVLGLCGAQGSGKSTLAAALAERLAAKGSTAAILSLDDLYLSRARRAVLARDVHPLFATRGAPGTHDVDLGVRLLDAAKAGRDLILPRFDKGLDDPAPADQWPRIAGPVDVLIFEGWCVGARPQPDAALATPVNALERDHDPDGLWRRRANRLLGEDYARLFARIDRRVLLAAPGFEVVERWRIQQERALRRRLAQDGDTGAHAMSDAAVAVFIQHYERLTRHILDDPAPGAHLVLRLDEDRNLRERP